MTDKNSAVLDSVAAKQNLAFSDLLPRVAAEYKPVGSQLRDLMSYCLRGHKLSVDEYYQMRLFDDEKYSPDEKKRFIGLQKLRQVLLALMKPNQFIGTVDDKLAYEKLMRAFEFDMPETLAIMGGHYPDGHMNRLENHQQLLEFLEGTDYPLFGKPIDSKQSLGSARFESFDASAGGVRLSSGEVISAETLWNEIQSGFSGGYLFQRCVEAHPQLQAICGGGLPTVRVVTLDTGDGPELFRASIKLPGKGNVADNFWRAGNMLAPVDLESGVMGPALSELGIDGKFLSHHAVTEQAIEGVALPYWDKVCDMALAAARLMPGAVVFGFDVAISVDKPVLIEANADPDLVMMQYAHQAGVLTDKMQAAVAYAGKIQADKIASNKKAFAEERAMIMSDVKQAISRKAA